MTNDNISVEDLWKVELEILDVIHNICVENQLKYSLAYGTLIGAIRHQGFIPWDDDIDIIMPRDDYKKLLAIWNDVAPKDYIIQDYNTDLDYTNNFAKVRKNHTTFLQEERERTKKYHKGIFVDIFPGDRVAPGFISRKIQYIACAINLLYSRGFRSGTGGVIGIVESILLKANHKNYPKYRKLAEKVMANWNYNDSLDFIFTGTIRTCKQYYPSDIFYNIKYQLFEDNKYLITEKYDEVLKIGYGEYMKLPPKEERVWKHHPIIVDFEKNYEERNEQRAY